MAAGGMYDQLGGGFHRYRLDLPAGLTGDRSDLPAGLSEHYLRHAARKHPPTSPSVLSLMVLVTWPGLMFTACYDLLMLLAAW
jgi:hypothetical protein